MKMSGMSVRSATRCCSSSPLSPGSVTSSTRQDGPIGRGRARNSCADANVSALPPRGFDEQPQRVAYRRILVDHENDEAGAGRAGCCRSEQGIGQTWFDRGKGSRTHRCHHGHPSASIRALNFRIGTRGFCKQSLPRAIPVRGCGRLIRALCPTFRANTTIPMTQGDPGPAAPFRRQSVATRRSRRRPNWRRRQAARATRRASPSGRAPAVRPDGRGPATTASPRWPRPRRECQSPRTGKTAERASAADRAVARFSE